MQWQCYVRWWWWQWYDDDDDDDLNGDEDYGGQQCQW